MLGVQVFAAGHAEAPGELLDPLVIHYEEQDWLPEPP
jgi:hypothetical protein